MSRSGGYNVYQLLQDRVVWHNLERDNTDLPKDSSSVIVEGWNFKGIARYCYRGWQREEGGGFVCEVKRWAMIPMDIWHAYVDNYFEKYKVVRKFQTEEEFELFKSKSLHISYKEIPEDAEVIGEFSKDLPYSFYNATIYYKDNQFYLCDGCKEWQMD